MVTSMFHMQACKSWQGQFLCYLTQIKPVLRKKNPIQTTNEYDKLLVLFWCRWSCRLLTWVPQRRWRPPSTCCVTSCSATTPPSSPWRTRNRTTNRYQYTSIPCWLNPGEQETGLQTGTSILQYHVDWFEIMLVVDICLYHYECQKLNLPNDLLKNRFYLTA